MEKVVATRFRNAPSLTGAIFLEHFGCQHQCSVDDALQTLLTPAQARLRTNGGWGDSSGIKAARGNSLGFREAIRLAILTNDINGAFNFVIYQRLIKVITLMKLPRYLTQWVSSSEVSRLTSFPFDGKVETPQLFNTGLPQDSPLSPTLFDIYSSAMTRTGPPLPVAAAATFVDDLGLIRGARSPTVAFTLLQPN